MGAVHLRKVHQSEAGVELYLQVPVLQQQEVRLSREVHYRAALELELLTKST